MGKNTVSAVWDIAKPLADELGLVLWDVIFRKEGANWYLRIIIDKDGCININDCVDMSHAIDEPLDEADPIEQSYNLQVSSPGTERELVRDFHYEWAMGKPVTLRLIRPRDGVREFKGRLAGYESGTVSLVLDDGTEFIAEKKDTAFVKLDDFEGF